MDYVAPYLALCLPNAYSMLDADMLVLGGLSVQLLGDPLLEAVNAHLAWLGVRRSRCRKRLCTDPAIGGVAMMSTRKGIRRLLSA